MEKSKKIKRMRKYFSAESAHGSSTSWGFSNDTIVYVFASKSDRDRYVRESHNLSVKAIKKSEVTKQATNFSLTQNKDIKPNPFKGEFWGIEEVEENDKGIIGQVTIFNDESVPWFIERLFK
jgi:hypothetical protein